MKHTTFSGPVTWSPYNPMNGHVIKLRDLRTVNTYSTPIVIIRVFDE